MRLLIAELGSQQYFSCHCLLLFGSPLVCMYLQLIWNLCLKNREKVGGVPKKYNRIKDTLIELSVN